MEIERGACVLDVAALVARLPDEDLLRLRGAMGLRGGPDELRRLLRAFYRLEQEVRAAVLERLEKVHRFTVRA